MPTGFALCAEARGMPVLLCTRAFAKVASPVQTWSTLGSFPGPLLILRKGRIISIRCAQLSRRSRMSVS